MKQMTLAEMIAVLERKDATQHVMYDFAHFRPDGIHSYRGYYEQIALGYSTDGDMTVFDLLKLLDDAIGEKFYGYKGGEYTMHSDTKVWVANHNESGGTAVVDIRDDGWCQRIITACIDP